MRIDPSALPFLGATLGPAALLLLTRHAAWGVPLVVLGGFLAYFFRDPDRTIPDEQDVVLAPADGRVVHAGSPQPRVAPAGAWHQVSIFLSPLDVHINRAPVAGRVTRVDYRPGRFLPAYRSNAAHDNERNEIWIEQNGDVVVCRQVVGMLARRIVCRVASGATVRAGERFGIMKFGSRIDLFLPLSATLLVGTGARVRAGETVLARLRSAAPAAHAGTREAPC